MFLKRLVAYDAHSGFLNENKGIGKIGNKYEDPLDACENYSEIFELVKKVVKSTLNMYRVGLMLVLADLPTGVGAFYTLGSNTIVMNRKLIRLFDKSDPKHKKEFTFLVLLHEYLHTLGLTDEAKVRELTHRIIIEYFGMEHSLAEIAEKGPFSIMPKPQHHTYASEGYPELIKDFEKSQPYIQ